MRGGKGVQNNQKSVTEFFEWPFTLISYSTSPSGRWSLLRHAAALREFAQISTVRIHDVTIWTSLKV